MMLNTAVSLAVLTLTLGVAPQALAQAPSQQGAPSAQQAAPQTPMTGQILTQDENTILAKDLIGQTVYASDNTQVGSISDLVLSKDGKSVEGYVIGVGGFLGIGEKHIALKMDRVQASPGGEGGMRVAIDAKKDELDKAPAFKSKKDIESEKQAKQSGPQQRPGGGMKKPGGY